MKKVIYLLLILGIVLGSSQACTNDEGGDDIDVITPADSTAANTKE